MNLLDMFEGREPHQQAIDKLEKSRIEFLEEKMDYYAKHGMVKEFQKAKEERDSYFKVQDECMGYGTLVGEQGLPDVADKQAKMARLNQPVQAGTDVVTPQQRVAGATMPSTTVLGKAKETFSSFANWLAGKDDTGPTYESAVEEQASAVSPVTAAKYAYDQMRKAFDDNVDIATIRWMNDPDTVTMSRNQLYHTLIKLKSMSRQNRNQFAMQTLANRNNFYLWLGGQKKIEPRPQLKQPKDPFQPELPLNKPTPGIPVSERAQKKKSEDEKYSDAEVARSVQKIRAKYPSARSDVEALAKDEIEHAKRSDQQLAAIKGANAEQDALLRQLVSLDKKQGQEIDNLDAENNNQDRELQRIQATNANLQKTIQAMTGTKQSARPKQVATVTPAVAVDPEIEKKIKDLTKTINDLSTNPPANQSDSETKVKLQRAEELLKQYMATAAGQANQTPDVLSTADQAQQQLAKGVTQPKKSAPRPRVPLGNLDVKPKAKAKAKATTTQPKATSTPSPEDEFDLLNIDETKPSTIVNRSIAAGKAMPKIDAKLAQHQQRRQELERRRAELDVKLADQEKADQAYWVKNAPRADRIKPAGSTLEEGQQLHPGDPIIVVAPNEFEGKTGEIYDFALSGSFVIVDLYNHGKHSMHLSDVAYNDYADKEEADDWYDEVDEGWYDHRSFPGAKIGPHIAGPQRTPIPQVKNQIIKSLMTAHKDLVDKYGQRDVNIVAQSEAAKADTSPQGITKAVNNVVNFLTSGLSVNRLRQQTLEDGVDETIEGQSDVATPHAIYIDNRLWKVYADAKTALAMEKKVKDSLKAHGRNQQVVVKPYYKEVAEGFQDFNKVEPYAVCLAGKPVKQFDYYEDARRFHDNWKKKLYREGNTEKADKITLMPLNLDEAVDQARALKAAQQAAKFMIRNLDDRAALKDYSMHFWSPERFYQGATMAMRGVGYDEIVKHITQDEPAWFPKPQYEAQTDYQKRRQRERDVDAGRPVKALPKNPQTDYARKRAKDRKDMEMGEATADQFGQAVRMASQTGKHLEKDPETHREIRRTAQQVAQRQKNIDRERAGYGNDPDEYADIDEAAEIRTKDDFLRQRDKLYRMIQLETNPANKQILKSAIRNLERRAAEEGWIKIIGEENSTSSEAAEIAIIKRILLAHTDLIMQFGLDKVTQAIEEVAYNVGDLDEIGTSDVSAWVNEVKQILGVPAELDEKWSEKYKRSIDCSHPKGFSQRAHCAGRKK
jgi:hypothetical protein